MTNDFTNVDIPHHGSHDNQPGPFIEGMVSDNFVLSTDGTKHGHPTKPALTALFHKLSQDSNANLHCTYDVSETCEQKVEMRKIVDTYPDRVRFPMNSENFLRIPLSEDSSLSIYDLLDSGNFASSSGSTSSMTSSSASQGSVPIEPTREVATKLQETASSCEETAALLQEMAEVLESTPGFSIALMGSDSGSSSDSDSGSDSDLDPAPRVS